MKSNFRWHYVGEPDDETPEQSKNLIVRCKCKKGYIKRIPSTHDYHIKINLCAAYYIDGCFYDLETDDLLTNVAAWCYLEDVCEQLDDTSLDFGPKEANDD